MSLHSPSQATLWQTLLPAAMVGTDKKTVAAPLLDGAVGALLAQVQAQAAQPALALLQMAGVLAVCERAGWQGQAPATPGSGAAACAIGPEEWVPLEPGDRSWTCCATTSRASPSRTACKCRCCFTPKRCQRCGK